MTEYKDVVIGGGELGLPLANLLSNSIPTVIVDSDKSKNRFLAQKVQERPTFFLHICIPYDDDFIGWVENYNDLYEPKSIIIHSTVPPGTGEHLEKVLGKPIISSPLRGKHTSMEQDLLKYTQWFGYNVYCNDEIHSEMMKRSRDSGIKFEELSNGRTCELAKILCDTTYQGWLIAFRYICDMVSNKYDVDSNEIWKFNEGSDKPIRYSDPQGIGGHCILPNLDLIDDNDFKWYLAKIIREINDLYKE